MIIQTGMRTDIPAFYSEWLMNRIQEGFVLVRNPYNPTQVTKYSLSPECILHEESGANASFYGAINTVWAVLVCHDHAIWTRH